MTRFPLGATLRALSRCMIPAALGSAAIPATAQIAATPPVAQDWAIHGQATLVVQGVGGFDSPYAGANSLTPRQLRETIDATAFIGVRPWSGAELWIDPEIDQGFGLSNTLGVAGFPSAEAYKVGRSTPYLRWQRAFLRQTIGLGGGRESVAAAANQLAGTRDTDRIVVTAGKIGVGDLFDTNRYAHDPRADFLNWSAVDNGSFDYAADAWGYATGVAVEAYRGAWTVRGGLFNLSTVPNGETLERGFGQYQLDAELEHRHAVAGRPGAVRLTVFRNRGRFSRFDTALATAPASGQPLDLAATRRRMTRIGVHMNMEQALTDELGLFARAGVADGAIEPYDFTDIDRTAQLGLSLAGGGWHRPADRLGLVGIVNGISAAHRRYLDEGGLGVLVGDGRLPHPGAERIVELYYAAQVAHGVDISLDGQHVVAPGYNRDRGPANIFAVRVHGDF